MPKRLFVATPTKLLTFADCKRKYRYTYLETPRPPKGPPWAHNTVGAIVHEVLADFLALAGIPPYAGRGRREDAIELA